MIAWAAGERLWALLGVSVVTVGAIASATNLHGVIWPEHTGKFVEQTIDVPKRVHRTSYLAPLGIIRTHALSYPAWFGLGPERVRIWYGYGPLDGPRKPAIILLHGADRDGLSVIDMWASLADREGLILIAPDSVPETQWNVLSDGPGFFHVVLRQAALTYPIDPEQVFVMGHSAGGIHALRLANLWDGPWRAVASHGGHISPWSVLPARSPEPILVYLGDGDEWFDVSGARLALKQMQKAGHDVSFSVIEDHKHWYFGVGENLSQRIWQDLQSLPQCSYARISCGSELN